MFAKNDQRHQNDQSSLPEKQFYSVVRYDPNTYEANQMFVYEVASASQRQQVPDNVKIENMDDVKPTAETLKLYLDASVGEEDDNTYLDGTDDSNKTDEDMNCDDSTDGHEVEENPNAKPQAKASFSGRSRTPGWHICTECSYTTSSRSNLTRHMIVHSEKQPHKCQTCERTFETRSALNLHAKRHLRGDPYPCPRCDAQFSNVYLFESHLRHEHPNTKPYRCTECDYFSVEKSKLKRHMRCHTGDRPFQCPHCTYAAGGSFNLKRHILTHTGEKPYACDVCDLRFAQSNVLVLHKLSHATAKPFRCEKCPSSFKKAGLLKGHVRAMHTPLKPYLCKTCNLTLPDKYQYKLHRQAHKVGQIYKCSLCPFSEVSPESMARHMIKVHEQSSDIKASKDDDALFQGSPESKKVLGVHLGGLKEGVEKESVENMDQEKDFKQPQVPHTPNEKSSHPTTSVGCSKNHLLAPKNHASFKCDFCDQSYKWKSELDRHKAINHEPVRASDETPKESVFNCHLCPREFAKNLSLTNHLRWHRKRADREFNRKNGCRTKKEPLFQMISDEIEVHIKDESKDASEHFGFNDDDED